MCEQKLIKINQDEGADFNFVHKNNGTLIAKKQCDKNHSVT